MKKAVNSASVPPFAANAAKQECGGRGVQHSRNEAGCISSLVTFIIGYIDDIFLFFLCYVRWDKELVVLWEKTF
jgi:hypothetical protein